MQEIRQYLDLFLILGNSTTYYIRKRIFLGPLLKMYLLKYKNGNGIYATFGRCTMYRI